MNSISEFKRKYGKKNKKNNDTLYKMDWFDNDNFDNMIARSRNRSRKSPPVEKAAVADRSKSSSPRSKSRSSKEKNPLKEIVAEINLEELSGSNPSGTLDVIELDETWSVPATIVNSFADKLLPA